MSDGIEFDFSELREFAAFLGDVPDEAKVNVLKATQVTARYVKDDWRKGADRTSLSGYAGDVTYETKATRDAVSAEIGPTPGDAGSLGIMEDAPGGVRSSPQHAGRDAARRNENDYMVGLLKAISDPLEG